MLLLIIFVVLVFFSLTHAPSRFIIQKKNKIFVTNFHYAFALQHTASVTDYIFAPTHIHKYCPCASVSFTVCKQKHTNLLIHMNNTALTALIQIHAHRVVGSITNLTKQTKNLPKKEFFSVFLATEFNCDVDVLCMECFGVGEIQQHDTIEVKVFDRIDCKIFAYYAFVLCKNIQRKHTTTAAMNCCFAFSTKILSGKLIITVYIFHWCVYGWINRRLIKSRYIYY